MGMHSPFLSRTGFSALLSNLRKWIWKLTSRYIVALCNKKTKQNIRYINKFIMENVHYYMHQNININDTDIEIVLNHLLSIIHNSTSWETDTIFIVHLLPTIKGDIRPIAPTVFVTLVKTPVPSVAPKNSTMRGILNLFLNSSQISTLSPFPNATRTLWTPSRSLCLMERVNINLTHFFDYCTGT